MTSHENNPRRAAALLKNYTTEAQHYSRASVVFACANGAAIIAGAWILADIIYKAVFLHRSLNDIMPMLGLLGGLYLVRAAFVYAAERYAFRGGAAVRALVRRDLIASILSRGPNFMAQFPSGVTINAYVEGVEALQGYYALTLPARVTAVMIPLAIFFFVIPADWVSALILLVTAPLIPLFMIWIGKGAEALNQKQWRRLSFMSGHFLDVIQGLGTLKLFNASRRESLILRRISDDLRRDTMAVLRIAFLSSLALEFFATVSIAMIAVLIGFRLLWGEMSFQQGFFVLLLAPEFYLPLRRMGTHYHTKMEAIAAAETISVLMTQPGEKAEDRSPLTPVPTKAITISFEEVSFAYPGNSPILQNINFNVAAGEKIALAGPSGSGKSTIIALLLGFIIPQSGRIMINGHDLAAMDMEAWRRTLSWLPQRPHLVPGSVAENLRRAAHDDQKMRILIQACGIDMFVDHLIGEGGAGLSGGQLQRIAMARALMRSSPILLLDEPTAHLDPGTEKALNEVLTEYTADVTVLYAAHRDASLAWADRIIMLEDGKIVSEKRKNTV